MARIRVSRSSVPELAVALACPPFAFGLPLLLPFAPFACLCSGDVAPRFDLVFAGPALGSKQCVQSICISARTSVWDDLAAFLVLCRVSDPPLDLIWRKRHF